MAGSRLAHGDGDSLRRVCHHPTDCGHRGPLDLLLHARDGQCRPTLCLRDSSGSVRAHAAPLVAVPRSATDGGPDYATDDGYPGDPGDDRQRPHRAVRQCLPAGGNPRLDVLAQLAVRPRVPVGRTPPVLDAPALQTSHQGGLAPGPGQHRPAGVTGAGDPRVHPDRARAGARRATERALPGPERRPPPGVSRRGAVSGPHDAAGRRLCGGRPHARDVVRSHARAGGRAHDRGCDPLLRLRLEPARPDEGPGALLLPIQQGQRGSGADCRSHGRAERCGGPTGGADGLRAEGRDRIAGRRVRIRGRSTGAVAYQPRDRTGRKGRHRRRHRGGQEYPGEPDPPLL